MNFRLFFIALTLTVLIITLLSIIHLQTNHAHPGAQGIERTMRDMRTTAPRTNAAVRRINTAVPRIYTTAHKIYTTPHSLKITPHDINTLNVGSSRYLENYFLQIENARVKHAQSNIGPFNYSCKPSSNVQVVDARNPKYFDILKNLSFVQTVFLRLSMNSIFEYMIPKYYGYGSNNCSMLGQVVLGLYGADCAENITEVIKSHPLQTRALDIGLPWRYNKMKVRVDQRNMTVTFIHLIQDAIVARYGDIYVENIHLISEGCKRNSGAQCFKPDLITNVQEYDEVLVISQHWGNGFYHNTLEVLPRLVTYLTFLQKNSHIKVHVNANTRVMRLMNIDKSRLVYGNIKAKLLYVPAGTPCGLSPLFSVQTLSHVLRENLQLTYIQKQNVIVLIKRSDRRKFKNHNSILEMLQKHASVVNMVVKVFADNPVPDIKETVSMFSQAAIVVAPHGAGESNLIFSKPGTILIEGAFWDKTRFNMCYRHMAQSLGLIYHGLVHPKNCFHITADNVEKIFIHYLNYVSQL